MAVVFLDITAGADPLGSILTTLDDSDIAGFEMRGAENELGSGAFTIRRDHPDATEANLATGNYVKVRIPLIQAEPVFGFWLDEHDDTLIARDEEGGETLMRGGPGTLFILRHANLLNDIHVPAQVNRGNRDVPGYWTWVGEPYGAILQRLLEEGRLQPGTPLTDVTDDFTRQHDSDSNAWPTVTETFEQAIGADGLTVYRALIESGELFVRAEPDLEVHAYMNRGEDLTGVAYGAGTVRFVKGENILTGLDRQGRGTLKATHAIVIGLDNTYRQIVDPAYVSGPGRWVTINYAESDDTALLDKVGAEALRKRNAQQDDIELEFLAGDDEANGLYLPFKHFNTGDLISLDTGTDPWDYADADFRVAGFRIVLGEASDDANDTLEARSLRWIAEIGAGPTSGAFGDARGQGKCCPGLRLCHDVPNTCDGGLYDVTPTQHFAPLGSPGTADAEGLVVYATGAQFFTPMPGHLSNWGFPVYGGAGGGDYAGNCTNSGLHFILIGAGTLVVQTALNGASSDKLMRVRVSHDVAGVVTTHEDYDFVAGDEITVVIPSDDADDCLHAVTFSDGAGPCGGAEWGWTGADWTAVNPTSIVGGPGASSGDSSRAAPCDHDHAYTSAQISHDGGTVEDALNASGSAAHEADTADAHDASAISFSPAGTIAATDVQAAIAEVSGDTTAHLADTADAHDASAISVVPVGGLVATDVQAALAELDGDIAASGIPATIFDAKGDIIVASAADTAARLPVSGVNGRVLTEDSAEATGLKWAAGGGGGGGLTQSFVGYNTIGGTWTGMVGAKHYLKKVTLAATTTFTSVDAYVRASADALADLSAMLLSDDTGVPDLLIGVNKVPFNTLLLSNATTGLPHGGRWLSLAIGATVPAGDYWIGVYTVSTGELDIANDASGADVTYAASGDFISGNHASFAHTTTTTRHSIRASVLS